MVPQYRDNNSLLLQAEWRQVVYKRFGATGFAGMGKVFHVVNNLLINNIRYSSGAGLRFALDKIQHINLRLDYGIGYRSSVF
ncbi:MAG: hypothetical protein ABI844_01585 [Saprospiraceae bacterium]